MKIRLQESIRVNRRLVDCYRYLLDFSTIEQWDPGVYRAEKITAGSPSVGTQFDLQLDVRGRRVPMRYELVAEEPGHQLTLHGTGSGIRAEDTISFHPLSEHETEIDYRADLELQSIPGLLKPAAQPYLRRLGRKTIQGLHTALTIPPASAQAGVCERLFDRLLLPGAVNFTERGYLHMPRKGLSEYMDGKVVVITGTTSGLGLAAACELSRLGATVMMLGRDRARLQRAKQQVLDFSGAPAQSVDFVVAELSLLAEVRRAAGEIIERYPRIDALINNAGALFQARGVTAEGHERTLAVNLLAPAQLTLALLPALAMAHGRVINMSSGGMYLQPLKVNDLEYERGAYDGARAYARAKRGLLVLTEHLSRQFGHYGVAFNAMHPGWAATPGVASSLPTFNRLLQGRLRDARMGADTAVWLASASEVAGESGRFWFDRKARATQLIPGTATTAAECEKLLSWLDDQLVGDLGGADDAVAISSTLR